VSLLMYIYKAMFVQQVNLCAPSRSICDPILFIPRMIHVITYCILYSRLFINRIFFYVALLYIYSI